MVWSVLGGLHLGRLMVNRYVEKRSRCSGVRFFLRRSVPMQRGARFLIFDVHLGGPTWTELERPKHI